MVGCVVSLLDHFFTYAKSYFKVNTKSDPLKAKK